VALDSRGSEASRPWIEAAHPTYPCLIDKEHKVAQLYGMLNVPSAVWIDESGGIVRPTESAGAIDTSRAIDRQTGQVSPEARAEAQRRRQLYYEALRDWVEKGEESVYALSGQKVLDRVRGTDERHSLGAANFRMGVYLYEQGRPSEAKRFLEEAQKLHPENWAFRRQSWNLEDTGQPVRRNMAALMDELGIKHFREPIDMPGMD